MSEQKQNETKWENVGVACMSNSGKALKIYVNKAGEAFINIENLQKVLNNQTPTASISATS